MTIIFLLHYYLERYGKTSPISPIIWICVCLHHSVVSHSLKTLGMCPPGFSVHGILQARILKYVAILFLLKKSIYFNWRLITLQYCSDFCDTLTWISHGCTCVPHHEPPPTFLPIPSLRVIPVHHPWAPCLMHRTWTGNLFHIWQYTCLNAILSNHPTLAFSHRVQQSVLYICVSFAVLHIGSSLPSF